MTCSYKFGCIFLLCTVRYIFFGINVISTLSGLTYKARVTYNRPAVYFPMLLNKIKTYTFDCHEEIATKLAEITTHPQQS